jgi:YqjK-like protein
MTHTLQTRAQRRAALIEQIAAERDCVRVGWHRAQQRFAATQEGLHLLREISRNPIALVAAAVATFAIGPTRSLTLLKNIVFGWSAWRSIAMSSRN